MDLTTLRSDARYLVFGDSTNTQYSNTDLDRNLNKAYAEIIALAISVNGDFQVNGNVVTTDLIANRSDYDLPTGLFKISEVRIKPTASSTEYLIAKKRDPKEVSVDMEAYKPENPEFDLIDIKGTLKIIFYWCNDFEAVTDGIEFYIQEEITQLAGTSDCPKLPVFAQEFLTIKAAQVFCEANEMFNKGTLLERKLFGDPSSPSEDGRKGLAGRIKDYYASRSNVEPVVITPKRNNYY